MNKKIKVIELLNLLAENKIEKATKIKYGGTIYIVDFPNLCGIYPEGGTTRAEDSLFAKLDICALDYDVEILEDKEEIDIKKLDITVEAIYDQDSKTIATENRFAINKIIDQLCKLDKKINKED